MPQEADISKFVEAWGIVIEVVGMGVEKSSE